MIESALRWLLQVLALPEIGLSSVFLVSFISATLLPLGSEPAVFAVVKANEALFWPAIVVATLGNTLGGALDYWIGSRAKDMLAPAGGRRWLGWVERVGPRAMLLSWLPGIGDPLCSLGGWLKMPFWPCVLYMALGKCLRYIALTGMLMAVPDGFWRRLLDLLA